MNITKNWSMNITCIICFSIETMRSMNINDIQRPGNWMIWGVLAILGTCQIYLNVQDDPGWIWTPPLIIGGGQVSGILLGTETKSLFRDNPSIFHRPRVMNPSWPYAWDIISAVSLKWGTPKSSKFMFTGGFSMGKPRSFWYLQV